MYCMYLGCLLCTLSTFYINKINCNCVILSFWSIAASDILLRQSCAKILVGDPHQQIYAFRGARNALQEVQSTHTFYLTQVSVNNLNKLLLDSIRRGTVV